MSLIRLKKAYRYILPTIILLLMSCMSERLESIHEQSVVFNIKDASEVGIVFSNNLNDTDQQNIVEYLYYYNGGGVAIGDLNNDGLEDIYLASNQGQDRLFFNNGNLNFTDVTISSGILQDDAWSTGVTIEDVNNDGWKDIYVSVVDRFTTGPKPHNRFYLNNQDGTFSEVAAQYGLDFSGYGTQAAFLDYDLDGDLDVYLLNHSIHSVRSYGKIDKRLIMDEKSGDRLLENKISESGKFENVSQSAGIYSSAMGYGLAVAVADVNGDGWTDIYVGNDFHENDYLYINNGDKTFTESIGKSFAHTTQFSMGVDIADIDNDGYLDIFTTDMMPFDAEVAMRSGGEDTDQLKRIKKDLQFELQNARNHLQMNRGDGTFVDHGYISKTYATDWSWSCLIQDFNMDGYKDIFVANGIVKRPNDLDYINYLNSNPSAVDNKNYSFDLIEKMPSQPIQNVLFTQNTSGKFSDLYASFVGEAGFSTGAAYGDLDNDGDMDIIINNINANASLYINKSNNEQSLTVELVDTSATVKGSKVIAYANGNVYYQEQQTVRGFLSSSTHRMQFTSSNVEFDSIIVYWPDRSQQSIQITSDNNFYKIIKDNSLKQVHFPFKVGGSTGYNSIDFVHRENNYYDDNTEFLIPERLSYEGPPIGVLDVNNDGKKDIFIGGGRGQACQLLINNSEGKFSPLKVSSFEKDAKYEDVDLAFIDFDNDGDKDLYIVSGGNDKETLSKELEDRIYLNNGQGDFRRIPISLPHTNGSTVSVGDFDNDGYEDLFVGARSIPGSYGLSPISYIMRNNKGILELIEKKRIGMITDSESVDIDSDGDLDLVLSGDWMSVKVLINDGGVFEDQTEKFKLEKYKGLWNCLEVTDINGDGKKDILAGNIGWNQKWDASFQQPVELHVGDFDENGFSDPIIMHYYFNQRMPFASFDMLSKQLPALKKKFSTYESFSKVTSIDDLIPDYKDRVIDRKQLTTTLSGAFIAGADTFSFVPFPKEMQLSDINDISTQNGRLIYIGNTSEYNAQLGSNLNDEGGIALINHSPEGMVSFDKKKNLKLPAFKPYKKIRQMDEGTLIITSNRGEVFKVQIN